MRFVTLGGAVVVATRRWQRYDWRCEGCGEGQSGVIEQTARADANNHAGWCRSLPPTQN